MDTQTNTLSSEISIALGIIRSLPESGNQWKMSDGNGLVTVTFEDKENGDFLGTLRIAAPSLRDSIAKEGDVLLCTARQTQHITSESAPNTLTKTLTITKVTAVSKRMNFP